MNVYVYIFIYRFFFFCLITDVSPWFPVPAHRSCVRPHTTTVGHRHQNRIFTNVSFAYAYTVDRGPRAGTRPVTVTVRRVITAVRITITYHRSCRKSTAPRVTRNRIAANACSTVTVIVRSSSPPYAADS